MVARRKTATARTKCRSTLAGLVAAIAFMVAGAAYAERTPFSQAVIDARVLGVALLEHGVTPAALQAYDAKLCKDISAVVLRNRGAGPFGLLNLLDERCGGVFNEIDDVIPAAERDALMGRYKAAAGFAMEALNTSAPIIAAGARVRGD